MSQSLHKQSSQTVQWLWSNDSPGGKARAMLLAAALLLLVIGSALAVVYSYYKSRQLVDELQRLDNLAIAYEEEWGRLLLEQSTWASHARIEKMARTDLQMILPEKENIVLIQPADRLVVK